MCYKSCNLKLKYTHFHRYCANLLINVQSIISTNYTTVLLIMSLASPRIECVVGDTPLFELWHSEWLYRDTCNQIFRVPQSWKVGECEVAIVMLKLRPPMSKRFWRNFWEKCCGCNIGNVSMFCNILCFYFHLQAVILV